MRKMYLCLVVLVALAVSNTAYSQMPPGGQWVEALSKLCGENKSFTAKTEITLEGEGSISLKGVFAVLDGNVRSEMEAVNMKSMPIAEIAAKLMDKSYQIMRIDKKVLCVVYPSVKAYAEVAMPPQWAANLDKPPKMETTELGKENIDGHPCMKNKVVLSAEKAGSQEFVVWAASDLNNFPIRVEAKIGAFKMTTKFSDVKLEKPDAKLFESPTDFTKYKTLLELMHASMSKLMPALEEAP